jgi:hypothetical protein
LAKLWQVRRVPLKITINKIVEKIYNAFHPKSEQDFYKKYFVDLQNLRPYKKLETGYFGIIDKSLLVEKKDLIEFLGNQILEHKFNLLGTGWINRNHIQNFEEIINLLPEFYRENSRKLFGYLNARNYKPINYWNDPKSGYLWEPKFYKKISILLGSDIKQPWELGRMQHLPILAYCYFLFQNDVVHSRKFLDEFQSQIIDFIATNPVGYTVQWLSPMDVGIRVSNWLFAYDLFSDLGAEFDQNFLDVFMQSIFEHIEFVLDNLEWSGGLRGNHYFANITSLLFACSYLPFSEYSTSILAFAINELISETLYQFLPDGGNFEASTYYHIQVVEMLLVSLYLIQSYERSRLYDLNEFLKLKGNIIFGKRNFKPSKFSIDLVNNRILYPNEFLERLYRIVKFTHSIFQTNDKFIQIGDSDSGFFLRPYYFFDNFKVNGEIFEEVQRRPFLYELINSLSENNCKGKSLVLKNSLKHSFNLPKSEIVIFRKVFPFVDFGLFVIKSAEFELFLRCGSIGQQGKGGHSHNDQLSFVLCVKGKEFFVDPGMYCYTCSEKERNKYRSVHMHNTLAIEDEEQNLWKVGDTENLFWIYKHRTKAKASKIFDDLIKMQHFAYTKPHIRIISYEPERIVFTDTLNSKKDKILYFHLHPNVDITIKNDIFILTNEQVTIKLRLPEASFEVKNYDYCPQYGVKLRASKIAVRSNERCLQWFIDFGIENEEPT